MHCAESSKPEKPGAIGCRQARGADEVRGRLARMVSSALVLGVRLYQHTLRLFFPPSCRFHPSCSEYAVGAFRKFGPLKGAWLSLRRLSRCHPFNPGGYDPLP